MHQTILMHADVNKGAKVGDVGDHALKRHARLEILEAFHALLKLRRLELGARVTARLVQLTQHVGDGRDTKTLVGIARRLQLAQEGRVADQPAHIAPGVAGDTLNQRIGFRVHCRGIQRVIAAHDAQKARCLLKGFLAQAADLEQLPTIAERAIVVAIVDDVLGDARVQAGDAGQQRGRSGVQIHANGVYAIFHYCVQTTGQLHLGDVVLILPHADGLGFNLYQFGQRVLQAAGN